MPGALDASMDPCELLGVSPGADAVALKRAYRRAALKWHPDKATCGKEEAEARDAVELVAKLEASETAAAEAAEAAGARRKEEVRLDRCSLCLRLC